MSILDRLFGDHDSRPRDTPGKPDMPMQAVLDTLAALPGSKPFWTVEPVEARTLPTPADAVKKILRDTVNGEHPSLGIQTRDLSIPGPAGAIQARIYSPDLDSTDLKPVVVYWHGGGWVFADIDVYDGGARGMSRFADCIVVSCHYRQAPENKFPAAHEDAFAAYKWVVDNAQSFGGDPRRIAVMGESAGGNMACATAIRARDEGVQAPVHQVLVYPVASNDLNSESFRENADAKPLSKAGMEWFVKYVFESPDDAADPRINLIEADLHGLPTTTIILAEIDPLRTGGEILADRLESAGVEVRHKTFHGSTHEFFGMALAVPDAGVAQQFAAHELKRAFKTAILPI